jgi:Tol biopolymer transport system component
MPDNYETIRSSPDGSKLAFDVGRRRRIWIYDPVRGVATAVTPTDVEATSPIWTPDGKRIVFMAARNRQVNLSVQNADGTGTVEAFAGVAGDVEAVRPDTWSRDGNTLLVTLLRRAGTDIGAIDRGDAWVRDLIGGTSHQGGAEVSPDGQWVAYESDHSGTFEVYVAQFPRLGDRQRISSGGGFSPRWSANGREIFYQSSDGRGIVAVPILRGSSTPDGTTPRFEAGKPERLFEGRYIVRNSPRVRPFEVARDGRFLLLKPEPVGDSNAVAAVTIVRNWTEELKQLVPSAGRR